MLVHPFARPGGIPTLHTLSQSPEGVHAPHARWMQKNRIRIAEALFFHLTFNAFWVISSLLTILIT